MRGSTEKIRRKPTRFFKFRHAERRKCSIWERNLESPPLKRFKGGTVILCGDKGMDAPHLVRLCGALCGGCTFRDYFAPSGLVPPSAGRTDNEGHYLRSVCTFRGYFAPWGLVPPQAAGRTDNEGHSLRSVCTFRGYFAPWGLVPLLRNRANRQRRTLLAECVHFQGLLRPFGARAIAAQWGEPTTKDTPCGVCALSGTSSPLRGSCHCCVMGRTDIRE